MLLSRDEFREAVFQRDSKKCVFCEKPAVDAHHILERRLFSEPEELGGYFLDNGASVCEGHHLLCEQTTITVEEIREKCGILNAVIPEHFYPDQIYDKWGNIILPNGQRMKGELFFDESVQKILEQGEFLHLFTNYVKYPRTYHVPWSPGMTNDDRKQRNMERFAGKNIVVMLKMDGEQLSMYNDHCHARSLDSDNHPSRSWSRNFHAKMGYNIPEGWRVCAENLFACHSIPYDELESFVLAFSIWNDRNVCLDWDETLTWFKLLDLKHPAILYEGAYNDEKLHEIEKSLNPEKDEGYVLRVRDAYPYHDFKKWVAKYVRKGHIKTSHDWRYNWKPNKMKGAIG